MWSLSCDVQNSYPLFYYRISQGKIMHSVISHPALALGIRCVCKLPRSSVYSKGSQGKKNHLPYPHFLITINIPDSFGIVALQTFVLTCQVCISDHRFPQICKRSLFPDQILSCSIETRLPLQRYKANLQKNMGIETRPPGCQPRAALISSCGGAGGIADVSWEIIGKGKKLEEMNRQMSTSFRLPIPQHLIRD